MSKPDDIEFDSDAVQAAEHWHGGQSSMLYALSSSGYLGRGTQRPTFYEDREPGENVRATRPMTDVEWIADLADRLKDEAEDAIRACRAQLKGKRGNERKELLADLEGLQSIVFTCLQKR